MHTLQQLLTTPTAASAGHALAESFRIVFVLLLALAGFAGLGHGPWATEFVLSVLLAMALVGSTTGALYLTWRVAFHYAWQAVLQRGTGR